MKHLVVKFKTLEVALKELEPFIRNGKALQSGRPLAQLAGMLPREALANWLICATLNCEYGAGRYCFSSDPTGGDGAIVDTGTDETWMTEHAMVPRIRTKKEAAKDIVDRILGAINLKRSKGIQYASGKQLVVLLDDGRGQWHPNEAAKNLPVPLLFENVWVVGLQHLDDGYCYGISQLCSSYGNTPTWLLTIEKNFSKWKVKRIQ